MSNGKMWQSGDGTETREKPDNRDKFPKKAPRRSNTGRRFGQDDFEELESLGLTASQYREIMGND